MALCQTKGIIIFYLTGDVFHNLHYIFLKIKYDINTTIRNDLKYFKFFIFTSQVFNIYSKKFRRSVRKSYCNWTGSFKQDFDFLPAFTKIKKKVIPSSPLIIFIALYNLSGLNERTQVHIINENN